MRFGAMNFPILPVIDEIDSFARMGFDYLELAMDPPLADYPTLVRQKASIIGVLRDSGLGLVCHLPTFLTTADLTASLRRASLEEMHHALNLAVELGAEKAVLHPSRVSGMGIHVLPTVKNYADDFLAEMTMAANASGIVICLENMFPQNRLGVEPDDFTEIFARFPSLKLTLDTGHAHIGDFRGTRLLGLVERFGKRLGHLHCSDNHGNRDEHLAVGRGSINFRRLVQRLKATGYDDTVTLEVFEQDRRLLVESREEIRRFFGLRPVPGWCSL